MQMKYGCSAVILIAAAALSVFFPATALFSGNGFLVSYISLPESRKMLLEIGILFLLLLFSFLVFRTRIGRVISAAVIAAIFCWLHVVFLPMVVSAVYLGAILLLGRFLRRRVFCFGENADWPVDFLLGSSLTIAGFCLLSALGAGKPELLRGLFIGLGAALYLGYTKTLYRNAKGWLLADAEADEERSAGRKLYVRQRLIPAFGASFVLTMILIQAGRMNIALDFDTLWYGVRSQYILAGGQGIYENPGLVGMVYVYSKGFEVLTLPLCDLASYSYLLFFNLWLTVMGLAVIFRIAAAFIGRSFSGLAVILASSIPGIMNMGISAKPDIITWLLQLMMLEFFFRYVNHQRERNERQPVWQLILLLGAYLLSLTMKPTSLVFSTALLGMMGIYLLATRRFSALAPLRHYAALLFPAAALIGIWGRTMMITGMPVTSVFTSLLARLGFQMKYPFATTPLPQNYQEESHLYVLLRRLGQMLLAPRGEDMGHVIIAWGSSLIFFMLIVIAVLSLGRWLYRREKKAADTAFHVIFWPFLAVNLVSLTMLYQVDGNYFMLLYSLLILAFCAVLSKSEKTGEKLRNVAFLLLVPILAFNLLITAQTNWAWSSGFSQIQLVHKGRINHEALQQERMITSGNAGIWQILAADPGTRVVAFGNHPFCLQFPCNVQSYKDITAPWGNVDLVESTESFEEYLNYAGTDYIYAEKGYIGPESWEWSYELLRSLIAEGRLTDFVFEYGNVLARVTWQTLPEEEARQNLESFDEQYQIYRPMEAEGEIQ